MAKWVYHFGGGAAEGRGRYAQPAGRQGRQSRGDVRSGPAGAAGLYRHHRGLHLLLRQRQDYPTELTAQVEAGVAHIEKIVGLKFGDPKAPLLVSVRSGARVSMPGMMDTVLNLGLNDETVKGLAANLGRCALCL